MNIEQKIKDLLNSVSNSGKIGVAITTHNRYDIFKTTYAEIKRFIPDNGVLVVVDDASSTPVPEATFRFNENVGIARAKNKCFELLYNAGCEHFFLFDDDCYPLVEDWYVPYVNSREPHLNYIFKNFKNVNKQINDTLEIYRDSDIVAYSHVRGCMCYFKRICLDKVGGMNPIFGRWGYEHPNLSNRIYNFGLTTFKYMDVPNSDKLIYSRDENTGNIGSTVDGQERQKWINENIPKYEASKDSIEFIPFREKENILLTCLFSNLNDTQRTTPIDTSKQALNPLISSLKGQNLVVLTDSIESSKEYNVEFIRVETSVKCVYFQRWVSYYQYLLKNKDNIGKIFIIDATDVEVLNNPFKNMQSGKLYTGDEVERTDCDWLKNHHPHKKIQDFIESNKDKVLLNAGLLGGDVETVLHFINRFLSFYFQSVSDSHFNTDRPDCGDTDMGLFNYIARTHFEDVLIHGTQVNTIFKDNKPNNVSFFKHK